MSSLKVTTLADDKRQATVERIVRAGRTLIGREGLDITVDEIADAAGVSRRTVFRHFATRENLLVASVEYGVRRYGEQLPSYDGGDWQTWLHELCTAVHRMNSAYGPGYWELTARRDLPSDLAAVERNRRRARRVTMRDIAATLWSAAGGSGAPPTTVTESVGAHLSAHFTAAVTTDAGSDWPRAADLAAAAIAATIREAL